MRKSASYAFYLAIFGIFSGECQARTAPSRASSHSSPEVCALEPKAKVSDACASYADLDALNEKLGPAVSALARNTDFFSYYRLNLYNKVCPFWSDENGLCGNIACAVTTLENEEDIPEIWRAEELSKLEGPKAHHPGRAQQREREHSRPLLGELGEDVGESCVLEYDDECDERDYCVPEDGRTSSKGDYVSLNDNPERFTGYAGKGAHQVWEAIYRENCFSRPPEHQPRGPSSPGLSAKPAILSPNQAQAALDFKQVMMARPPREDNQDTLELDFEGECVEKRVFYRIISGMHASISTHLCHDYLNQSTGRWGPNLACYRERLHSHPDRISNLYFNYALVLRAVGKLRDCVDDYTFCTGDAFQDVRTRELVRNLALSVPGGGDTLFDESRMFKDTTTAGVDLKEDFRARFRNVSRIMDCVGCDKCRLWGKIQTNGLGAALKVLFESDGVEAAPPVLRRTELVALINTLDKISASLSAIAEFRDMIAAELRIDVPSSAGGPSSSERANVGTGASAGTGANGERGRGDDILDEFDDFSEDRVRLSDVHVPSLREEFGIVIDAMWLVTQAWMQLPATLGKIAWLESTRLWKIWLGMRPPDREWEISWPDRDELRRRLRREL